MGVPQQPIPRGDHDWATGTAYWLDLRTEQVSDMVNGYRDTNGTFHPFPFTGMPRFIPKGAGGDAERQAARALNDAWPGATPAEKDAFVAYIARWGQISMPRGPFDIDNIAEFEEFLRSYFFQEGMSRCHTCRVSGIAMPSTRSGKPVSTLPAARHVPIGRDPEIMPCGCLYQDAIYEMWCIFTGRWTQRDSVAFTPHLSQNDLKINPMPNRHQCRMLAGESAPVAGVGPLFQDYASRTVRITALQLQVTASGSLDNAGGVATMPPGRWNARK